NHALSTNAFTRSPGRSPAGDPGRDAPVWHQPAVPPAGRAGRAHGRGPGAHECRIAALSRAQRTGAAGRRRAVERSPPAAGCAPRCSVRVRAGARFSRARPQRAGRAALLGLAAVVAAAPPVWAWKDPRTSLTLPIWREVFPRAQVVHIIRNGI